MGYGGNKAACLFEMYLAGISYYVLSDHFIIHQNHLYEESARKLEVSNLPKINVDHRPHIVLINSASTIANYMQTLKRRLACGK